MRCEHGNGKNPLREKTVGTAQVDPGRVRRSYRLRKPLRALAVPGKRQFGVRSAGRFEQAVKL